MADRLSEKVVFITGAGSGIARAAARIFTREGAKVLIAEIDEGRGRACEAEVRRAGGEARFVSTDVTSEESVRAALAACADSFGRIDVLFNCAGGSIAEDRAVTEVELAVWDHTINLDLKGPFLCCRHGIPHLIEAGGGAIVNVASVVALKGNFRGHVYTAAKGGIVSLTRALAGRYWRDHIRANAIAPGVVLTERVGGRSGVDLDAPPEVQIAQAQERMRSVFDKQHPFGYGLPDDIANVALFLASEESRMVNGALIPADGGFSAY